MCSLMTLLKLCSILHPVYVQRQGTLFTCLQICTWIDYGAISADLLLVTLPRSKYELA